MDISKQLHAYEVEYHVLQDELQENVNPCDEGEPLEKLERVNSHLKRQNMDLLEKLQVSDLGLQTHREVISVIQPIEECLFKMSVRGFQTARSYAAEQFCQLW